MAGVIKPLALGAASKVRCLKNKKAAHTIRPAPTPGPLILALTVLIHFDSPIKEFSCLRTFPIHSPASVPTDRRRLSFKDGPEGADTIFLQCE